ncbi:MAG: 50S ribosomal protein L5 [Patescibacteria group bacterium]|nr:50S ribosomal protein L5 [Patescibacteria group bacterium]
MQKHDLKNKLEKVVVNVGIGRFSTQPNFEDKFVPEVAKELSSVTGQYPSLRSAQKSISGFKLRQGTVVGLKTTLRGRRMNSMVSKIVNIALPRVRDFRGIDTRAIDKNGNLNIGLKEHLVFPEIIPEHSKVNFGIQITMVPKLPIKNNAEAVEFYKKIGVPFKK